MTIFHLLTVLFVGLKLTNVIDWSWVMVVSPLVVNLVLFILIAVLEAKVRK